MYIKAKSRLTVILILLSFVVISVVSITAIFALTQQSIRTEVGVSYTPENNNEAILTLLESTNDELTVVECDASATGTVIIPKSYGGIKVSAISAHAFENCKNLTEVIIQEGVIKIGDSAFSGCTNLTSVEIPESVTSIGNSVFKNCSNLSEVTLPNSVIEIGAYAFFECDSLMSIKIPEGVTTIQPYSFWDCDWLQTVTIPKSVINIDSTAFWECLNLRYFDVDTNNEVYHSFNRNCIIETQSKTLVLGGASCIIPNDGSVTTIGEYAFYGRGDLRNIDIPANVTTIENEAFYNCVLLSSVSFKNPNGWFVTDNSTATTGTDLSNEDLSNETTAATYLRETYCDKYWICNK